MIQGNDNLLSISLKQICNEICLPLNIRLDKSFETEIFPEDYKSKRLFQCTKIKLYVGMTSQTVAQYKYCLQYPKYLKSIEHTIFKQK